ncbi:hypothetical protein GW796_07610 [archaeon]|nr:hypothetical protein [archaeon]
MVKSYKEIFESVCTKCFSDFNKENIEKFYKIKEEKRLQEALNITVNGEQFKALTMCDVLWSGWESDSLAWVVNDNGSKRLVTSNHGSLNFDTQKFLEDKLKEYEDVANQTKAMLELLKN